MPQYIGVYSANHIAISVSTAITILQVKAGTTKQFEILRAWVTQSSSTTMYMQRIQLLRKTGAATVTSYTPLLLNPASPAADAAGGSSATGYTASSEGTDGDLLINDVFNTLNGWLYLPTPEERIKVPASGIVALKFPAAPAAAMTFTASIIFGEY